MCACANEKFEKADDVLVFPSIYAFDVVDLFVCIFNNSRKKPRDLVHG